MKKRGNSMKAMIGIFFMLLMSLPVLSQEEDLEAKEKGLRSSNNLTWEGNKKLSENNFIEAEVDYRRAIAESPENAAAPYNLGNAYYNNETFSEAFGRFKEAGETATSKKEKHKAYHNMGNVFMKRKDYAKAVEAYKEALRNDPKDEETRYNLALAKEMLKKDEENKDKNDEDKDKEEEEKKDKDENKEGDNKDDKDQDKKDQGDEGDKGDEGDEKKDENKEGDGDEKEEQKKKPEQGDQPQDQPQKRPNQLSKQQVENLLRAMQNAEKKVQDKIDAKKVQGAKVKNEKDW